MKRTTLSSLVLALLIGVTGYATAQTAVKDPAATPRIDQRQANQQARINEGVASGQITPKEQARLQGQQNRIAADKSAAKADGVVTQRERHALKHEQNHASRNIHRKKHNGKHAGGDMQKAPEMKK
jgi:hypothetical protein